MMSLLSLFLQLNWYLGWTVHVMLLMRKNKNRKILVRKKINSELLLTVYIKYELD